MIEARVRKARRLLDLHRGLQRLEEERVAGLRSRQAELVALQEETVGALSGDGGLQGLLMPVVMRRLKSFSEESVRVATELEWRSRALQTLAARKKVAERLSRAYEQQHIRIRADRELRDIIERITRPKDASLP